MPPETTESGSHISPGYSMLFQSVLEVAQGFSVLDQRVCKVTFYLSQKEEV